MKFTDQLLSLSIKSIHGELAWKRVDIFQVKFISLLIFVLFSCTVRAQTDTSSLVTHIDKNTIVESESYFPGGVNAWTNFLSRNINYPEWAMTKGIQGTVVV